VTEGKTGSSEEKALLEKMRKNVDDYTPGSRMRELARKYLNEKAKPDASS
jgi:hypothetical protein